MTPQKLINELKKMPKDAIIAWRDHDQEEGELNGTLKYIELVDFKDIQPNMWDLDCEVVVLSS